MCIIYDIHCIFQCGYMVHLYCMSQSGASTEAMTVKWILCVDFLCLTCACNIWLLTGTWYSKTTKGHCPASTWSWTINNFTFCSLPHRKVYANSSNRRDVINYLFQCPYHWWTSLLCSDIIYETWKNTNSLIHMWANNFDGIKINIIVNDFLFSLFLNLNILISKRPIR